jgi:hypothetical protein
MPRRVRPILAVASVAVAAIALLAGCESKPKATSTVPSPPTPWTQRMPKDRHIKYNKDKDSFEFDSMVDAISPQNGEYMRWNVDPTDWPNADSVTVDFWWRHPFDESHYNLTKGQTTTSAPRVSSDSSRIYPYKITVYRKDSKKHQVIVDPGIIIEDPAPLQ